jgi:hypothetical protein
MIKPQGHKAWKANRSPRFDRVKEGALTDSG